MQDQMPQHQPIPQQPAAPGAAAPNRKKKVCPPCVFFGFLTMAAIAYGIYRLVLFMR